MPNGIALCGLPGYLRDWRVILLHVSLLACGAFRRYHWFGTGSGTINRMKRYAESDPHVPIILLMVAGVGCWFHHRFQDVANAIVE